MTKRRPLTPEEVEAARNLRMLWDRAKEPLCLTQEKAADLLGFKSQSTISQYLLGNIPLNTDAVLAFSGLLQVSPSDIDKRLKNLTFPSSPSVLPPPACNVSGPLRSIVTWESPDDLPEGQYLFVPRRRVRLSAGNGRIAFEEESAPPLAFESNWVRSEGLRFKNLVVVYADGDSMEPQIRNGDVLLLNLASTEVRDGNVYALRCADHIRVKRLFRQYDGALILRSDNPEYPDETVPPADQDGHVSVIGEVIWRGGKMARSKA